jgi:hypothetical protein
MVEPSIVFPFGTLGVGAAGDQITGDLFPKKLIVGHVAIERVDDPIAILVRLRHGIIRRVAARVGIAHDIEPVPTPAFPVAGRCEQTIHDLLKRLRRGVGQKFRHLLRRWRQTGEVKRDPAKERPLIRRRRGCHPRLLKSGKNEIIHRRAKP